MSRLEQDVRELRRAAGVPALAAVRVSSAGVEEIALDGIRRAGAPGAVELADRWHIGSNAKAMTAMLAGVAVEGGELQWTTGAAQVLGEVARSPSVRQLLAHAAGVPPYTDDDAIAAVSLSDGDPMEQRVAFARTALADPPPFEPGAAHAYSNGGVTVAATMVEQVSGEPWETALVSRIFEPLGIDGRVGWPALHAEHAPLGHRLVDGAPVPHDPTVDAYALPVWLRPAGDVSLSIGDYGIFLADQLAGLAGRGRLGSAATYRALHAPDPPDRPDDVAYALGWGVRQSEDGPVSMHTGSAETFYAVAVLQPMRDRGMALLANSFGDEQAATVNRLVKAFLSG